MSGEVSSYFNYFNGVFRGAFLGTFKIGESGGASVLLPVHGEKVAAAG
jgi:hypothetical protein